MKQKGMSIEKCVSEAQILISEQNSCLLLFDVKGSRNFDNASRLIKKLKIMMEDLNHQFEEYFPKHNLAVYGRKEKGFQFLLGDGSWTAIDSAKIIPEIIQYQKEKYPDIPLYWGIARDGYDKGRTKIVK